MPAQLRRHARTALGLGFVFVGLFGTALTGCKKDKESLILVQLSTDGPAPATLVSLTISATGRVETFHLSAALSTDISQPTVFGVYVDETGDIPVGVTARPASGQCDGFSGSRGARLDEAGGKATIQILLRPTNVCNGAGGHGGTGQGGSGGGVVAPVCTGTAPPVGVPPALTCCTPYDHADLTGSNDCDQGTQVYTVAFSPDGSMAITGGDDGRVVFWTYDGTHLAREPGGHYVRDAAYGIAAFSPDGSMVAVGGAGFVDVYYLTGGSRAWTLATEMTVDGTVYGLGWTPDSQRVISLDGSANLYVHTLAGGAPLYRAAVPVTGPWGLAVAPAAVNGLLGVAVLDRDGLSAIYGVSSQGIGTPTTIDSNLDPVWSGCFSPDGKLFVLGQEDSFAHFYNFPVTSTTPTGPDITIGNVDDVFGCAFSPNGSYLALAGGYMQGSASVWTTSARAMTSRYDFFDDRYQGLSVAFAPSGNALLVGGTECGKVLLCRE